MATPKLHTGPVGGIAFFLTIPTLLIVAALNARFLSLALLENSGSVLIWSLLPAAAGAAGARYAISGRFAVFIHEFKHSLVSGLAGNRSRGMSVRSRSGKFEYEFTKKTAHLNALIALAPYWFPLLALAALAALIPFGGPRSALTRGLFAAALGADAALNVGDIGPHQTDFSEIRGGYSVGLVYTAAMNLMLWSVAASLLALGWRGPLEVLKGYGLLAAMVAGAWR